MNDILCENGIQIFDNYLNAQEMDILSEILNKKMYNFNHNSGNREKIVTEFFSFYNKDDFFTNYLKHKIELSVKKKLNIVRHYMHIQTFGQDGGYHIDDTGSNKYTFCLYINDVYSSLSDDTTIQYVNLDETSGEFLIKIPMQNYILSIDTLNNRGIFFHSQFIHKGMAYNRFIDKPRLCITWKFEEIYIS